MLVRCATGTLCQTRAFGTLGALDPDDGAPESGGMTDGRWWVALVTFERSDGDQDILPTWAQGACGWMVALAPDEDEAREILMRDVSHHGLRVLDVEETREVFDEAEIDGLDGHLAANFRNFEPGKQTAWGTIHCYKGDGEA